MKLLAVAGHGAHAHTRARALRTWLALLLLASALPAAAAAGKAADIESQLRGRPEQAVVAIDAALPLASGPARVELLVLRGLMQARMEDAEGTLQTAAVLEPASASGTQPGPDVPALHQAAARLLRARALMKSGPLGRADRLLADAAARLPADAPPLLRLQLLDTQARVKRNMGRLDEALRLYQETVALADAHGAGWLRSEQRAVMAYTLHLARQPQRALAVNAEAIALAEQQGDLHSRSGAMVTESIVRGALGQPAAELRALRAAIELARAAGATRDEAVAMANLSDYYLKLGDNATALEVARAALPLTRRVNVTGGESVALANAGLALIALQRTDEGADLVRQALLLEERAGSLPGQLTIQHELGAALEKTGHLDAAWDAFQAYRRLTDELHQRTQQDAVLEAHEAFEADRRQREVRALRTETGLKEAQLEGRDWRQRLWSVAVLAGVLLLFVVGALVRRMRRSNTLLSHSNAALQLASVRDPLTGLANRRHLHNVMAASGTQGSAFDGTLLLLDIDHFKRVNDTHGHAAGDAVLVEIAARLRAALRDNDLTVRWGGEEFLVLVRELPLPQVEALAERLLATIGTRPVVHGRLSIAVTASIGFATFPLLPERRPLSWERALDLIDSAMYLAKAHGRNRAYGVSALDDGGDPAALEAAWRSGHADLTLLSGPQAAAA